MLIHGDLTMSFPSNALELMCQNSFYHMSALLSVVIGVCLSVCLSITLWYIFQKTDLQ